MMKDECAMMDYFFFDRCFTVFALENGMEMGSSASFISPAICSALIMPESTGNSNRYTVPSNSCKPPSMLLTSSASERPGLYPMRFGCLEP